MAFQMLIGTSNPLVQELSRPPAISTYGIFMAASDSTQLHLRAMALIWNFHHTAAEPKAIA